MLDGFTTETFCRRQLVCAHFTGQNKSLLFINDLTVIFLGPVSYMYLSICYIYIYTYSHICFLNVDFPVLLTKTGTETGQMLQGNFLHL